ncbi:NAD(P)-dependent oxidoreductase [Aliarcobacter faecis]|uniref:NAD-dependent epimerase/dehydratase family protein n=1 Tax=Aliarcobacter faecis TaxID=1564138 RepID=UPI00047CCA80|nr:NAD(P)-dependent oxidoreductase [Aliarcobacter faecis]QKF72295.1 NAD(P)-dependent oxidoreductase [Aliarcobacter faecis]
MREVIVISGVTGMTGNELARQYVNKGVNVVGFDNFFASSIRSVSDLESNKHFTFFEYDINNIEQMRKLQKYLELNYKDYNLYFINCAAVVHTKHFYNVNDTFETNVLGMKSFLDMAIGLRAKKFINCSTSEVYSMQSWKKEGVKEEDSITLATVENSQRTSYATGKLLTEFFIKDAVLKDLIQGCSIRFANVYSNDELYSEHIIPYIIDKLKSNNCITLLENSKINSRTFLHNYDSCSSIISLLESDKALDGSVYNVGTQEEIQILELVQKIANKMNIKNLQIYYDGYRENDPIRRLLNTDKIKAKTNWKETITLNMGLDMCINTKVKNNE